MICTGRDPVEVEEAASSSALMLRVLRFTPAERLTQITMSRREKKGKRSVRVEGKCDHPSTNPLFVSSLHPTGTQRRRCCGGTGNCSTMSWEKGVCSRPELLRATSRTEGGYGFEPHRWMVPWERERSAGGKGEGQREHRPRENARFVGLVPCVFIDAHQPPSSGARSKVRSKRKGGLSVRGKCQTVGIILLHVGNVPGLILSSFAVSLRRSRRLEGEEK